VQAVLKAEAAPGFTMCDVGEPSAAPGELLLRVVAASVCGTDVHLYEWNPWAQSRVRPPRIMGHEICGEVVARGEGVNGLAIGSRVAVESHITCGRCKECRRGDLHVCEKTQLLGVDVDGGFAPLVAIPAANAIPVGDTVPEVAAAMEPFGNAVHACSAGELAGAVVGVFGCGPIGCASIAVARARGAERIVAVDRNRYRLGLAEKMGADSLVEAGDGVEADVRRAAGGELDCALEMSGAASATVAAIRCTRPGGWVSLLGLGDTPVSLDLSTDVVMRGISMHGIVGRRIPRDWASTTAYIRDGVLRPQDLITHRFELADIDEAMRLMQSGECGKVSLRP
jgi:threonine 3-dehydrogenase